MKRNIIFNILGFILLTLFSCQQEELRVVYPESHPMFEEAFVAEDSITYGDTIHLHLNITDSKTPLSTLSVKVVVNDEIIKSEVFRTKGNAYLDTLIYKIPFAPRMPENADVEVHMKIINVEGFETDTIIYNTKAHRPVINSIWLVTATSATTIEVPLKKDTTAQYVYPATVNFGNTIAFRLATKVSRLKKVDWTGIVFGSVNNALGLITTVDDPWYTISDPTLLKVKRIVIDLYNFTLTYEGQLLEPATTLNLADFTTENLTSTNHLGTTANQPWKTSTMYLGVNTEMTFTGINNLANALNPDFFEVTGASTAKFIGNTGMYKMYYLPSRNYLTLEQPDAVYPNALWLDGVGFGWPATPLTKSASWNWNTPEEYTFCRKLSPGIFQATLFVNHESDNNFGTDYWRHQFSTKFFYQRGWGSNDDKTKNEANANNFTLPSLLKAQTDGNWAGSDELLDKPGIYRIVVDMNLKTTTFTKIN